MCWTMDIVHYRMCKDQFSEMSREQSRDLHPAKRK